MNRARFLNITGSVILLMNLLLGVEGLSLLAAIIFFVGAMIIQEIKEK